MSMIEQFRQRLARNIALIGVFVFGIAACIMLLATCIGVFGMCIGELAPLHVLALLGMTAGFGILAALFEACASMCGADIFK